MTPRAADAAQVTGHTWYDGDAAIRNLGGHRISDGENEEGSEMRCRNSGKPWENIGKYRKSIGKYWTIEENPMENKGTNR